MKPKRNKYGINLGVFGKAARTIDGILFASKAEARYYAELKVRERMGEIQNIARQVPFDLRCGEIIIRTPTGRIMRYVADFSYDNLATCTTVFVDVKGFRDKVSMLKISIVEALYGIKIRIVK